MRLILMVVVTACFTMLLAGCSKDKGIVAPENFTAQPSEAAKDTVKAPKLPPPPGN
jgi:uncharacterized lipoprotein YbaY